MSSDLSPNFEIYTLCYADYFLFSELQAYFLEKERCVAYRNVLHVEWRQKHIFIFDYGVIVFWQLTSDQRKEFVDKLASFAKNRIPNLIDDEFTFETIPNARSFIKNDHIILPNKEIMTWLAISHGIAQSTKLAQFEDLVQMTINDTVYIPENIARTGSTQLSRKELAKLRGRLFIVNSDIMLNYDLLDVPDFFWEYPELELFYSTVADYLEIKQRVEVLSKKLDTIHELFNMMADEQKHKHSSLLEWIIIWLIAFEIIVFFIHDVFSLI